MRVFLLGEGYGVYDLHRICLDRGITVLGFVDPTRTLTLHAKAPALSLEDVATRPCDLIVIANPHFAECQARLLELGVPASRLLTFYENVAQSLERLGPVVAYTSRRRGTLDEYRVYPLEGKSSADTRTHRFGPEEAERAERLLTMFRACQDGLASQDPLYAVGKFWGNCMRATKGELYRAAAENNSRLLNDLLANFWRNNLGWGVIGGTEAFAGFRAMSDEFYRPHMHHYLRMLSQSLDRELDLDAIALPPAGNPFGMVMDGRLVQENSIINHYRGAYLASLLSPLEKPVVAEIGGGVGYFARSILRENPRVTYIDFDLPETLIVAAYVLASEFPERRVLFYDGTIQALTRDVLDAYDIILMPTYMLPNLEGETVDLFVNTISFGEMSPAIVDNYLTQMERVTRRFFYHENLCELHFDIEQYDFENFSADFFHVPETFTRLFSAPSRWPFFGPESPHHHFTENLYLKSAGPGVPR